jgi:hypothetical protein
MTFMLNSAKGADVDMRRRNATFNLIFFGSEVYETFEVREAAVLGTVVVLFTLALMSCAALRAQIQTAQHAIAATRSQVLFAPPAIANERGTSGYPPGAVCGVPEPFLDLGE